MPSLYVECQESYGVSPILVADMKVSRLRRLEIDTTWENRPKPASLFISPYPLLESASSSTASFTLKSASPNVETASQPRSPSVGAASQTHDLKIIKVAWSVKAIREKKRLLLQLIEIYPQITLVVDALDECNKETRASFLEKLDILVSGKSSYLVKIFISSRPELDIKHRFSDESNMEIRATNNEKDIAMFVDDKIKDKKEWYCKISSELRELICETLVSKSDGM